ncbi:DUF4283 domain protein, partial [Trifolium medium]|nr:DUF4283 domain protein [Trifolium medium]
PPDVAGCAAETGGSEGLSTKQPRSKRANSCPSDECRVAIYGPWSLEWLQDHNHGDAGVIFSANRRNMKGNQSGGRQDMEGQQDPKRRKAGGLLRHPLFCMKKVARLPSKDRSEVLKVLKKELRQRQGVKGAKRSSDISRQASSEESTSS